MSVAEELTFHLEDFDGPLELLLALVAKHKMDLHNIPILELIDQMCIRDSPWPAAPGWRGGCPP